MPAKWRDVPPIAVGRPSQNLGSPFNNQLNRLTTLPMSVFESNPIPTRALQRVNAVADTTIPNSMKNAVSFRQRMMTPITEIIHGLRKE